MAKEGATSRRLVDAGRIGMMQGMKWKDYVLDGKSLERGVGR